MQLDLRRRLALALIGLSVALSGALAAALWIGNNWIESTTLDHVLRREIEVYVDAAVDPSKLAGDMPLRYYRPSAGGPPVPPELARLETGSHRGSIVAVAEGRADVCAIDCRSWQMAELYEPKAELVQVVGWTGRRKGLPMITSLHTPDDVVERLIDILSPV